MTQFNPFEFFNSTFSKEKINSQQAKAQDFLQTFSVETQKQLAKAPKRIDETIKVATENFSSLQNTLQQSLSQLNNPQEVLKLWGEHFKEVYDSNLELVKKHHEENLAVFSELNESFKKTSSEVTKEAEEVVKDLQKKSNTIHKQFKDNMEVAQNQSLEILHNVQAQTSNLTSKFQDQIEKNMAQATKITEDFSQALQTTKSNSKSSSKK